MTPPNPFVALASDPVGFLAALGYALLLAGFVVAGVGLTLRKGTALLMLATDRNTRQRDWWGDTFGGWLPTPSWIAWFVALVFLWAVIAWAAGALIWLVGG